MYSADTCEWTDKLLNNAGVFTYYYTFYVSVKLGNIQKNLMDSKYNSELVAAAGQTGGQVATTIMAWPLLMAVQHATQ